jgi:hypothetical protein
MARPKRDQVLRHDIPIEEEDSFLPREQRDTGVVLSDKPRREGKGKRSIEDMMAAMPNAIVQSAYALERIAAAEDQIVKVLQLCSPEARELVLKQRPTLKRYAPEE